MKRNTILTIAGALLAIAGLVAVILTKGTGNWQIPAFLAVGVGCGVFGGNLGELLAQKAARANPDMAKRMAVEQHDERNVALSNMAKAKAYNGMIYIFGILMMLYALMKVSLWAVLALVAAYLLVVGLYVFYLSKYQREM